MEHLDAIILGSGQAGNPLATALAAAGWKTILVEQAHIGGSCINVGCTPTKTMVASARVASLARRAADFGIQTDTVRVDMAAVRRRKQTLVDDFRGGSQARLEKTKGLDLVFGQASFVDAKTVVVSMPGGTTRTFTAETIFINTGARPAVPHLPGLDTVPFLNSTTVMELNRVPEHLLILGGGYVALEFSQMFRRFGSRVTIIERNAQFLPREDRDIADTMLKILREDGMSVSLGVSAKNVRQGGRGVELTIAGGAGERVLSGSHLLVATGRTPNTNMLNLGAAGIVSDEKGYIRVNDTLETSVPGIYALGDVKGGPAFTHVSYDDFRIIRTNLLEGGNATIRGRLVPYVVFTDPELAHVGMHETEAREQGNNVLVASMPMDWVARALEMDESRGMIKVVVDKKTEQILGCTVLGVMGGELMAMAEIAMLGNIPYPALREAIFVHPTLAELWNNLFARLG